MVNITSKNLSSVAFMYLVTTDYILFTVTFWGFRFMYFNHFPHKLIYLHNKNAINVLYLLLADTLLYSTCHVYTFHAHAAIMSNGAKIIVT